MLATDRQVYHRGQPVVMTLTETNTSNHAVTVPLGPSTDGFYVTQNGREVWASNTGPQPLFVVLKTLQAGRVVHTVGHLERPREPRPRVDTGRCARRSQPGCGRGADHDPAFRRRDGMHVRFVIGPAAAFHPACSSAFSSARVLACWRSVGQVA